MRHSITSLFKKMFQKVGNILRPKKKHIPVKPGGAFQPERKKPPSKWVLTHNRLQVTRSNKIRKRRKANKVARKQRQINRRKAA